MILLPSQAPMQKQLYYYYCYHRMSLNLIGIFL